MNGFVALLILVALSQSSISNEVREIPKCSGTDMTEKFRLDALSHHDHYRKKLKDDNNEKGYPPTNDMKPLQYDCQLENDALQSAQYYCQHPIDPHLIHLGANIDTQTGRVAGGKAFVNVGATIGKWWDTARSYTQSKSLLPTRHDPSEAPFLQMANGNMTKIGCAFSICDPKSDKTDATDGESSDDESDNFVVPPVKIVCMYGPPYIADGVPLYTPRT
ncbi:hypothetical protein KIN20_023070 [Parelaphostrongylus tenuis]|uniref:SCP domain-containing protein n=1 Tax=Parelaphostrongylus tenuis TaxID=148309 RepID=A0AAD5MR57_PARTN|nr:hypothetical protein KIN20_023070 [Parelaphostrongylus tenuis]